MKKAVIFDLFETLITQHGRTKPTTRMIAEELNIDPDRFRQIWEKLHPDRYRGRFRDTYSVIEYIVQEMRTPLNRAKIIELSDCRDAFHRSCFSPSDARIIRLLQTLVDEGVRIGLVSNCSFDEIGGFRECEWNGWMDSIVLSCETGLVKPDPEIFKLCASRLGVLPDDCLYVGDGGSDELRGASKVGMTAVQAVWFTRGHVTECENQEGFPILNLPQEVIRFLHSMPS